MCWKTFEILPHPRPAIAGHPLSMWRGGKSAEGRLGERQHKAINKLIYAQGFV